MGHPVPWYPLVLHPQFLLRIVNIVSNQMVESMDENLRMNGQLCRVSFLNLFCQEKTGQGESEVELESEDSE